MVADAMRMGDQKAAHRVYMQVPTLELAEQLVSARHALKGSGVAVFDVLSPEERSLHRRLWPSYLAAVAEGRRAQFSRCCLKVDGVRVVPPSA